MEESKKSIVSNSLETIKVYYSQSKWKEYPNYYVYEESGPFSSEDEKGQNKNTIGYKQSAKGRVTGSIITKCIKYDTILAAKKIAGLYREEFTEEQSIRVNYGKDHEKDAREWYILSTGNIVKSPYFAVPKFDYRLGAEHDGFIYDKDGNELDGILEIKCPMEIYEPLLNITRPFLRLSGEKDNDYSHISESHYDQMQMEMEIFDKSWCDYVVYCIPKNFVFLERVYRNKEYWNILYEKIRIFIDAKLTPLLNEIGSEYPYNPKTITTK